MDIGVVVAEYGHIQAQTVIQPLGLHAQLPDRNLFFIVGITEAGGAGCPAIESTRVVAGGVFGIDVNVVVDVVGDVGQVAEIIPALIRAGGVRTVVFIVQEGRFFVFGVANPARDINGLGNAVGGLEVNCHRFLLLAVGEVSDPGFASIKAKGQSLGAQAGPAKFSRTIAKGLIQGDQAGGCGIGNQELNRQGRCLGIILKRLLVQIEDPAGEKQAVVHHRAGDLDLVGLCLNALEGRGSPKR